MTAVMTAKALSLDKIPVEKIRHSDSADVIHQYLSDEAGSHQGRADKVFFPENEIEAASVMAYASENKIPLTISGGGTGLTGSRVPMGGIILATEKMIAVRENPDMKDYLITSQALSGQISFYLNAEKAMAILPAGLSLSDIMPALTDKGLIYPPNPTEWTSLIGGNVSTNASGGRSFKYGAVRPWVKRARIILPTGHLLDLGRGEFFADSSGFFSIEYPDGVVKKVPTPSYAMPRVKNASGLYSTPGMDLLDLFIGCEGILGLFSEIGLELVKTDGKEIFGCIVFFPDEEKAVGFVKEARKKSRDAGSVLDAITIDYFDGRALEFIKKSQPGIPDGSKAAVFIEQLVDEDGEEQLEAWMELFEEFDVIEDWSAMEEKDRERLRLFRHSLPETVNETMRQRGIRKMGMDLAVPDDRLEDLMRIYREVGAGSGSDYLMFGHIGDNNLHFNFLPKTEDQMDQVRSAYLTIAGNAIAMGGTISAEHGVGKKQFPVDGIMTPYLGLMYSQDELQSIALVKKALDPSLILNRGNMICEKMLDKCC